MQFNFSEKKSSIQFLDINSEEASILTFRKSAKFEIANP